MPTRENYMDEEEILHYYSYHSSFVFKLRMCNIKLDKVMELTVHFLEDRCFETFFPGTSSHEWKYLVV